MEIYCHYFRLQDIGEKFPVGFIVIACHLGFGLRIDTNKKVWYIVGGNLTGVTSSMASSNVDSRKTVCISFMMDDLNVINILAGNIQNVFLKAPTK